MAILRGDRRGGGKKIETGARVALGHSLDLKIVAEGVETREQCEIPQQLGCDELQSFYMSAPVSSRKFVCLVKKHNKVNQLPLI